jgi:hypothetical protein
MAIARNVDDCSAILELSKNNRVIRNAGFALMSSVCARGGNMAAAIKYARFSAPELRDVQNLPESVEECGISGTEV